MITADNEQPKLNSRFVTDTGDFGTIRYCGPVPKSSLESGGLWYGVEWDNPERGKHDGTHDGICYFRTRNPKSGSFLRAAKCKGKLNFGRTFLDAFLEKYTVGLEVDAERKNQAVGKDELDRLISFGGNSKIMVETVGFGKIESKLKKLDTIQVVGLLDSRIAYGNAVFQIKDVCPGIEDLDLSRNLLADWSQIALIAGQLPHLKCLRLAKNKLDAVPEGIEHEFSRVEKLVLSQTDFELEQVCKLAAYMPNLSNLQLGCNRYDQLIKFSSTTFSTLARLNLEGNDIASWDDVSLCLGSLPQLQKLDISHSKLDSIRYKPNTFLQLETLFVHNTEICDWESVDALESFPCLREIRLKNCPLVDKLGASSSIAVNLIARLSKADVINGSTVSARDRAEAEKYFLTILGREVAEKFPGADRTESAVSIYLQQNYPRAVSELENKYGAIVPVTNNIVTGALKKHMLNVTIAFYDERISTESELSLLAEQRANFQVEKLFPATISVRSLKLVVSKLIPNKLKPNELGVYAKYSKTGQVVSLDDAMKDLGAYSIENNDTLYFCKNM